MRRWSWLSPAVGLALLCAICWGTVRLPGDGVVSAVVVLVLTVAAVVYLRGRLEGGGEALADRARRSRSLALLAASLPFVVEGHFGILGTGFNPDMSQHLLAADRLAARPGLRSSCTRATRSARTRSSSPSTRAWASASSRASTASPSRSRSSPR